MTLALSGNAFAIEKIDEITNDTSLLYTESYSNPQVYNSDGRSYSNSNNQLRLDRHNELIALGYELVSISSEEIDSPQTRAYNNLETRAVTSYYTQPIKRDTQRGSILDGISSVNTYIFTPLSFLPKVGWIPSTLGITSSLLSDFVSRGETEFRMASTLRFYDIDVREKGTSRYYFVASSERSERTITITTLGYRENGTPFGDTKSKNFVSQSPNYNKFYSLSEIAKEYFTTGGPYNTYVYFEDYPEINYNF